MNEKLVLQDLVEALSKKAKISKKEADLFFRELFQLILERIFENDLVKIKDFGTFKLTSINSRESVDVNTGEKIEIPAHLRFSFLPDKALKNLVNKPFSQFETILLEDGVDFSTIEGEREEDPEDNLEESNLDEKVLSNVKKDRFQIENSLKRKVDDSERETIKEAKEVESDSILPKNATNSTSFIYTYTSGSSTKKSVSISVPKDDLMSSPTSLSTSNAESDSLITDKASQIIEIRPKPTKDIKIDTIKKNDVDELDADSEIEIDEDVVFSPPFKSLGEKDIFPRKTSLENTIERSLIPLEDELESGDSNSSFSEIYRKSPHFSQPDDSGNFDLPIFEEKNIPYSDYDSNFNDQELNAKPTLGSRLKKNIAVILMMVAILIFGIYGCLSIFDVKFDHEYYLGHPNLTSADDTSSLALEASVLGIDVDSVNPSVIESDESAMDIPLDTDLPTVIKNELGMRQLKKDKSVRDTTSSKIDVSKLDRVISPVLSIGVVNKGTFYLSKLYQQDKDPVVELAGVNKKVLDEENYDTQQDVYHNYSKYQTVTLERGTTLRSLSNQYYGDPSYWVYIYEANRAKLSNPNDISMGMKVFIPELSDYGVHNPKDPTSLQKAKELESQLLRW